jgi:hypothetical protein
MPGRCLAVTFAHYETFLAMYSLRKPL